MTAFTNLKKTRIFTTHFVEITFSTGTLRLFDGLGVETLPGVGTFVSESSSWGKLGAVQAFNRDVGSITSGFPLTFFAGPDLITAVRNPAEQGAPVRVWFAEIDPTSGVINVTQDRIGFFNVGSIAHGITPVVELEVSSPADYVGDDDEYLDLSDRSQKIIDSSDLFCQFMLDTDRTLPWGGRDAQRPVLGGNGLNTGTFDPMTGGFSGGGGGGSFDNWNFTL
jgi:hypothetical protein